MNCAVHVCVPMIYVSREPIAPPRNRKLTIDEQSEVNERQPGYYKCAVAGCYRVERIPHVEFVMPKQTHNCPACGKISDAPAERIVHHGYRCNACSLLKNKERSRIRRDKTHRSIFGDRPEALRREAQTNA